MNGLFQDLRDSSRKLVKTPAFTLMVVLTLALGIGANTALFSVVNGVLLRPLPFHDAARLVTLWESIPAKGVDQQRVAPPNYRDWQEQNSVFEEMAFWTGPFDFNLVSQDGPEKTSAVYASSSLFAVLRVQAQPGRGFLPEEDQFEGPQSALISNTLWQEQFGGDPEIVGQSLTVDTFGRRTYTIAGVMPPGFQFPDRTKLWLPAGWNDLPQNHRQGHWLNVLACLQSDATLTKAVTEMNSIQARIVNANPGVRTGTEVSVVPLLRQTVGRNATTSLAVLWGVVVGVLLIACANVANLMLARASSRRKETAVRLALGAGPWRVMRQWLTESILLSLLGGAVGTLLGSWCLKLFIAASPPNIPRLAEVSIDGTALFFALGAALVTGLLVGLAPAWQSSRPDLNEALKESGRGAAGSVATGRTRHSLIVAEVALATVLLVGAGLMLQSFSRLLATDRGFRPQQIVTAELDFSVAGFSTWLRPTSTRPQVKIQELLERVRQLPDVQSAGAAYRFLRSDNRPSGQTFAIFGRPVASAADRPTAEHNAITPDYLRTLNIRLLRGRDFNEADRLESPGVALVNESFVRRFFPNQDPLGQHVTMEGSPGALGTKNRHGLSVWSEIVGIVSDVKSLSTQPKSAPEIYRPYWQWPMQNPTLYVRAANEASALAPIIRSETASVIPNLPTPEIRMMSERFGESITLPRFHAGLLTLFGALALLVCPAGV